MRESLRIQSVQSPIIPVVGQLIREHPGTISLGQGVVWYPPPPEAFAEINTFLADPSLHKYQAVYGIPQLVELIVEKLRAENGIDVGQGSRVVVTAGGNMAFINALLAVADAGGEVILQTPYYFNHEMAITMANCRAVLVPTDENYQLQPKLIAEAMTEKTRAVVTISPNNPTGAVYREADLREVNRLCAQRGVYHISDEAYEYFTYGAKHFSPGSIAGSHEHTISLYSLSKAYGFASWRIGFMVIPEQLFEAVNKIQDTILICPPVVSQFAAAGAMRVGAGYCRERVEQLAEVRELVLHELEQLKKVCVIPQTEGAFYFFLKVNTTKTPLELVERLVKEHGVAAIPGTAFGMPAEEGCYLRVSYGALQKETVTEGVGRLVRGIKSILDNLGACEMKIIGLQLDTVWENKAANHAKALALLDQAQPPAGSLVVLAEMFATGFSMNVTAINDSDSHETQEFLSRTAAAREIYLLGGVVTKDKTGRGRNESVVYAPDGSELARYCKLHPFRLGGETEHYVAGESLCLFNWQEFTVASFICYDLRFPEIFRSAARRGANLFTVIASWPSLRADHWVSLLKARAIENQAYVIGVNRCGNDPKLRHSGHSVIFDPSGKLLADAGSEEAWMEAEADHQSLLAYRRGLPFLMDLRDEYVH